MTLSPNGGIFNGADLNADSDFVVINTVIGHEVGDYGLVPSDARNLDILMKLIQTKVNVKYIHVSSAVVDLSVAANRTALGLGTGFNQAATTVYTIKFMAEQKKFLLASDVVALLDGLDVSLATAGVPHQGGAVTVAAYDLVDAAEKNTAVVISDLL